MGHGPMYDAADDPVARVSAWAAGIAVFASVTALLSWALRFAIVRLFVAGSFATAVSMAAFGIVEDIVFSVRERRRMDENKKVET